MLHGGDLKQAIEVYGGDFEDWLDLSTGINPFSYPIDGVAEAASWQRLPADGALAELIETAKSTYEISPGTSVVAAAGTQTVIQLLPLLFAGFERVEIVGPTYGSYADAWQLFGKKAHLINELKMPETPNCLQILVNPNNPDGRLYRAEDILHHVDGLAQRGSALLVDEAYGELMPSASIGTYLNGYNNLYLLKSFGKFFGLAGLRLGFFCGPVDICRVLKGLLGCWAVSGPAIAIGHKALADLRWQREMREQLHGLSQLQENVIKRQSIEIIGGTELYQLIRVREGAKLHAHLAEYKIWSRIFDYDATWLRLGLCRNSNELDRLEHALKMF
ncbi:threonine-phosphate decarboxylase [Polycladidibacter stylochi]|uniref:threonine-phosphate decarboxylase n=1 Tax=Polycladidibacter stylochi TaxID=1807766 RepID=UPI0008363F0F|nr:threonine-phosphate decarboxylase [Pseudovibrio stylochi]